MAKQTINIGAIANDRTGDPLRIAFRKTNENFTEVYDTLNTLDVPRDIADLNDAGNLLTEKDHIVLQSRIAPIESTSVTFTKEPNTISSLVFDEIDTNMILTRDATGIGGTGGGLYNKAVETVWDATESPVGTEWNADGWDNLDDVKFRYYGTLRETLRNRIGENILNNELVMHDTINDKYYTFMFTQWGQGAAHDGSFSYTRKLIDSEKLVGVEFPDGSIQIKAATDFSKLPRAFVGDTSQDDLIPRYAGRLIEAFNTTIYVPDPETYDIPVGTFMAVSAGGDEVIIEKRNTAIIYDPKGIQVNSWEIKRRTTAIIIKTGTNTWNILYGYALTDISELTDNQGLLSNLPSVGSIEFDGDSGITSSTSDMSIYVSDNSIGGTSPLTLSTASLHHVTNSFTLGNNYSEFIWYNFEGKNYVSFVSTDPTMISNYNDIGNNVNDRIYVNNGAYILSIPEAPEKFFAGADTYFLQVVEFPPENLTITEVTFDFYVTKTNFIEMANDDFTLEVNDDIRITGNDVVSIRNNSVTQPVTVVANYDGDGKYWEFRVDGFLQFPDGGAVAFGSNVPTTSKGQSGDFAGLMVFDDNYIYRCVSDYTDGIADIWKRIQWSGDTW